MEVRVYPQAGYVSDYGPRTSQNARSVHIDLDNGTRLIILADGYMCVFGADDPLALKSKSEPYAYYLSEDGKRYIEEDCP
uniref:Uncharacterized protein n=1 Tax=viral metagenome TaxID=1070528 RepID=A0A6M3LBD1_9ZZZZ